MSNSPGTNSSVHSPYDHWSGECRGRIEWL